MSSTGGFPKHGSIQLFCSTKLVVITSPDFGHPACFLTRSVVHLATLRRHTIQILLSVGKQIEGAMQSDETAHEANRHQKAPPDDECTAAGVMFVVSCPKFPQGGGPIDQRNRKYT